MPQFPATQDTTGPSFDSGILDTDLGYRYPMGLDLRPNSPLHNKLITEITKRARDSQGKMSKRYSTWREIERNVTAYVPLDEEETRIKANDSRKPVRVVVPFSYLMRDIMNTYLCATFLDNPYHRYSGVGPEDQMAAMLLEQDIDAQNRRFKNGLAYYVQFNDCLTYGFGVVTPTWEVETAFKTKWQPEQYSTPWGVTDTGRMIRSQVEQVMCEGSRVHNIDPYNYYPDPNVPIHRVQEGEFVSWLQPDNYSNCLASDQLSSLESLNTNAQYFNVRYLDGVEGRSTLTSDKNSGREEKYGGLGTNQGHSSYARPVDKLVMYINLVPAVWSLGKRTSYEKWMFVIGGDKVVLQAQPINLNHQRFPVAVACPNLDGYTNSPISALEVCFPLQEVADFIYSSRLAAVRKSLHDMFLVNPQMVYMPDVLNPHPAKVIRLRKSAWGQPLDNVLKQLNVQDVTGGHFKDLAGVADLIERVTGATDILQGMAPDAGNERTTATQVQSQKSAAISRLQKVAKLISIQSMSEMGYFLAEHTQQFKEQASYLQVTGQWMQSLAADLGPSGRMQTMPWDLSCDYDVVAHDGAMPDNTQYAASLQNLFQQALADPELRQSYDLTRMFSQFAKMAGVKNMDDFRRALPPMGVTAMPNEQVQQQAQAGNLVDLSSYNAARSNVA